MTALGPPFPGQFHAMAGVETILPDIGKMIQYDENRLLETMLNEMLNEPMMGAKFRAKMWVHGVDNPMDLVRCWPDYSLFEVAGKITCPTLVFDSEDEHLMTGQAQNLYDTLRCPKDYVMLKNDEGAGQHGAGGALTRFHQLAFDWLDDTLQAKISSPS